MYCYKKYHLSDLREYILLILRTFLYILLQKPTELCWVLKQNQLKLEHMYDLFCMQKETNANFPFVKVLKKFTKIHHNVKFVQDK